MASPLLKLSDAAEKIGFRTRGVHLSFEQLKEVATPCILHWDQNHFVVLISVSKHKVNIADPAVGVTSFAIQDFKNHWIPYYAEKDEQIGVALLLEPTPAFYAQEGEKERKLSWNRILRYLIQSKRQITKVFVALVFSSLIQLVFPFLTQSIVDVGIRAKDLQYITIILLAQMMLMLSRTMVDFIRSRLLLRISNILNLKLLSKSNLTITKESNERK